ncbi:ABC transporter permease [Flavihumibacter solisilvae]|uniref:Antimicrobial peptide ABC transporter permease n=1 Tax=Flavihumibacter solisilvae TaxID=1349421 RepID=A0A0C1L792_9BACT|nr:ABC transporter permease [Flavihumibacter solisilvae]KIC96017.1 antimicrobial peptide ABC transporter permease [Flavihumibacter solisilvae]
MLRNYFITAFRNLQRNKVYSLINVSGLSIGLACAMLILLFIKDEASYDKFHRDVEQVYRVGYLNIRPDGVSEKNGFSGYFQGPRFASNVAGIKHFVRYQEHYRDLKTATEIRSQQVFLTDTAFFDVFSFPLLSGDPSSALDNPYNVVISEKMARQQFGNVDVIGQTLLLKEEDEFKPYVVTGVAKNCPENSSIRFDVLLPIKVSAKDEADNENWFNFFLNTFVKLQPGADVKAIEANMQKFYETDAAASIKMIAEKYNMKDRSVYFLQPFTDMHLSKELPASNGLTGASNPMYSYILSGIAIFILLIACINFINLTVARSIKRAREIGIRKVIGGARRQLVIQFLGESFVLCFIAFILAIFLAHLVLPVFNHLSNKALSVSYLVDAELITGYLILFLITGLLAGFYPALVLSRYNPVQTLYSRFNMGGKNYLQKSLVVVQFTLATFLIIGTLTIFSQFNYLVTKDLGYEDSNVIYTENRAFPHNTSQLLTQELMKIPGITEVCYKNGGSWGTRARVNGDKEIGFAYETVSANYLPLLQIPVVQGRNFSPELVSDSNNSILVNESFVKEAQWQQPLGKQVDFWYRNEKYTVVGVVKDYHYEGVQNKIGPQLFTMKPGNPYGKVLIRVRPNSIASVLPRMEKVFKGQFPLDPYIFKFADEENLRYYESEARWKQILLFSAILTIFISCIGLFGLTVLSTEKRTKEIGIRKVLGASVASVTTILSKDFLKLVVISLLMSFPIAWIAAEKWLANYPYRIQPGWWLFASAGILVISVALLTVSLQAVKAATANPVKSLKTE